MKKQMKLFTFLTKPLVLFALLFAFGVGEMWAGTKTVYVETTQCSTYDNVYIHYWDDGSGDQVATQITDYFWMASIPENAKWCVFRKVDGSGYNYLENVTNSDNFFYVVSFDQSKGNSHATTHLKTYDGTEYIYWRTNPADYNAWGDDNATLQIRLIRLDGDNLGFVNATDKDATTDHIARYLVPAGTYIRPELHTTKNNAYSKTFEFSATATDNFIYNFTNDGGRANWATTFFARSAYVYFDNTNSQWTDAYKEILVGRDGTSDTYNMTLVPNTNNLYCYTSGLTYNDFTQFCFVGNSSHWGQYNDNPNNRKGSANTNTANYQVNMDHSSRLYNLFIPAGTTKGTSLTHTAYGDYTSLNYTQTVEQKLSENGGDSYSTSTRALATVSVNSYKMTSATGTTADGGSITSGQSSKSCDAARTATVTYLVSSVAEGYTFVGWYDGDTEKSTSTTYTYEATEAKTITARFKANAYTVVFNGNDKTSGSTSNQTFYYNVAQNLTTNAYGKNGYNFGGWTTNNDGTGSSYTNGQSVSNWSSTDGASITIYAKWTQNVTLDLESGTSGSTSVTATYNSATLGSYDNPERSGYTFGGYYSGDDGTGELIINTSKALQANKTDNADVYTGAGGIWKHAGATTLHAQWTAKDYTINLANMEATTPGTTSVDVTFDASTNMTASNPIIKPTKTHYDFAGYWTSENTGVTLDHQLIAADGKWIKEVEGYTSHDGSGNPTWVHDYAISLYAKWTEHEYAVTLAISPAGTGTTSPASSTTAKYVTASGDITATPSTGYSFREWGFSETGTGNYDVYVSDGSSYSSTDATIRIKAQRDGTLTANFTPNTYTVSFENLGADAGHKGSLDTTVTFNDTIHMKGRIEVPSKTNYDFGGYYISTNKGATLTTQIIDANGNWNKGVSGYTGEKDGVASWVCAADTVLYAKWTEIKHTVAVEVSPAGAGAVQVSGENITEVTYVGVATKSAEMTPVANAGWVFKEWQVSSANLQMDLINYHSNYQKEGTNAMKVNATADEQTLTAVFEPRYYLVGGEIMSGEDGTGTGTTSGMPGWNNYTNPFNIVTSSPLLATCTLTLGTNKHFYIMVRDKADGNSYGKSSSTLGDESIAEPITFTDQDNRVLFHSNGGTNYTFKITGVDGSERPIVSVERPHQILIGRRRVDIDGDEHDDDLGGTVALSEQTAPDTWTPISNEAWVSYGHSVKYDASPVSGYSLAWYTESNYSSLFTTESYWFHSASATGKGYAQFTEKATTVTLANDGHGKIQIGGEDKTETTVGVTTTRSLTAVPNDGYMFSSWTEVSGDDITLSSTSENPTTLSGNGAGAASGQEVQANFTYRWALSAESVGWGSEEFTIENILTDGSGNTIGYVDINLAANTNYQFTIKDKLNDDIYKIGGTSVLYMDKNNCSNWTFGTGGDRSNCGITTAGKGTYRFSWNPSTYKLSVTYPAAQLISCGAATENGGTGGSITAIKDEANNDYSNGQYISEGNTITFTATPTDGYEFVGWFSNNNYNAVPVTSENPWNFTVAEPVNVYALFAEENVYYFDGNNGTSTDWTTPTNWTRNVVPTTSSHTVRILKPVTVSNGTKVHVANVDIVTGGSFTPAGGSALTASGQLNIADGGMLIVAGSVKKVADASAMSTKAPTDYDDLNIGSSLANGNGALVIGSHDGTNKAHVAFATKAKKDDAGHNVNQFIGTPFNDENYIFYNYYGTKIYEFKAARDGNKGANNEWQRLPNDGDMTPFWGYNILTSQTTSPTLWMQGTLNSSANHTANLYFKDGDTQTENMLANSWVSPIDITKFQAADFSANVEQTIYIYNAGTVEDEKTAGDEAADASNPGQWIVLPINSTPWTSPTVTVIPSMQAFSVYVTAASQTLTMDYNRLVYNPAVNGTATIVPNRAPRRYTEEEAPSVLKIRVSGESGYSDQIVLLSREDFTFGYDNGWDGRKIMGDDAAPQLYTITQDGKMSIDCTPLIEGTLVGFKPGEADPFYTIRFDYDGDETLYLNDLQMQLSTPIDAEYTYSFSAYANDAESRFVISATPISQTATGIDRTETVSELRKIIIHDHLYIIRQGRIYTAHGQLVK